ncbi:MAG TPA: hypothetical protein PLP17_13275 [Oligoflexia bacterium]|nr:hypothetical protein [Oligoflexia bacterium]
MGWHIFGIIAGALALLAAVSLFLSLICFWPKVKAYSVGENEAKYFTFWQNVRLFVLLLAMVVLLLIFGAALIVSSWNGMSGG